MWETIVAWDAPEHYGVACKRDELRDRSVTSVFNRRRLMPEALRHCIERVDARLMVLSYNDESWIALDELVDFCRPRGAVEVLAFDSRRYVGALIGVHDRQGRRVGTPNRMHNVEYLVVSGELDLVEAAVAGAVRTRRSAHRVDAAARSRSRG